MEEQPHQVAPIPADACPQVGAELPGQPLEGTIREADAPRAVDRHGGEGLVIREHHPYRGHHLRHLRVVERARPEQGREAGGDEPVVALAQRHLEGLTELQDHRAARVRAPRLEETHMALRDAGLERQAELRQAALLPPRAEQVRKGWCLGSARRGQGGRHAGIVAEWARAFNDLAGN